MKRPRTAKKSATRRRPPARARKPERAKPVAAAIDPEAVGYLNQLAAALGSLMEAQGRWIPEIDAASRNQALVNDHEWRSRITVALNEMLAAADGLRVQPVPGSMQVVDGAIGEAQAEARLAGQGFAEAVDKADMRAMLAALQHIDRMNQFIQRARALVSA